MIEQPQIPKEIKETKQAKDIQEIKDIQQFYCKHGNKGSLVCSSQKCKKNAFVCRNQQCNCMIEEHRRCDYTMVQPLLKQIIQKRGVIPQEVAKAINAIQKLYQDAIDTLSIDRQNLLYWKQNYGVSVQQAKFLDLFKSGKKQQITGELVYKIKSQIDCAQNVEWLTQDWVSKFWDKEKNAFDRIFGKISQLGHSQTMKRKYFDSLITNQSMKLKDFYQKPVATFQLLYRASENEHSIDKFYEKCAGVQHTMVLILTEHDKIIGGYTPLVWKKPQKEEYIKDPSKQTFIFSLSNNEKFPLVRQSDAIKYQTTWGPIFGGGNGWDMSIPDRSKNSSGGIFNFPASYNNGKYSSNQAGHEALSGVKSGYYSQIKEWQVFKVIFKENKTEK